MNTTKTSLIIKTVKPDPVLLRKARQSNKDLEGFIKKQGGIRCRNRKELDLTVDALMLQGIIAEASSELETLVKKAKKLGLLKSGRFVLQKA
jgi:hypothetical protein